MTASNPSIVEIQTVIDALKAELEAVNPAAAELIYPIEMDLKNQNNLTDEIMIRLDAQILVCFPASPSKLTQNRQHILFAILVLLLERC